MCNTRALNGPSHFVYHDLAGDLPDMTSGDHRHRSVKSFAEGFDTTEIRNLKAMVPASGYAIIEARRRCEQEIRDPRDASRTVGCALSSPRAPHDFLLEPVKSWRRKTGKQRSGPRFSREPVVGPNCGKLAASGHIYQGCFDQAWAGFLCASRKRRKRLGWAACLRHDSFVGTLTGRTDSLGRE